MKLRRAAARLMQSVCSYTRLFRLVWAPNEAMAESLCFRVLVLPMLGVAVIFFPSHFGHPAMFMPA